MAMRKAASHRVQKPAETQQFGRLMHAIPPCGAVSHRAQCADQNIVMHAHVAQQAAMLERTYQATPADRTGREAGYILTTERQPPRGRAIEAADHVKGGA